MAGSIDGAPSACTDAGPPEKITPFGRLRRELGGGDRVGDDLGVDVGLADAAGDQLRVLGAEVDDEDGVEVGLQLRRDSPAVTTSSAFWSSLTDS